MEQRRLIPPRRITSGLLAAFLMTTLTGSSKAPPETPKEAETNPTPNNLAELREQVQELSSALRVMRAEVEKAHSEVIEIRQELRNTRDQLLAIKSEVAPTLNRAQAQAAPIPSAPASREGEAPQLDQRVSKLEEEQQLLGAKVDDQYQSKVESGSKYRVRLSGMALFNAFTTRGASNNFDLPDYAVPRYPPESNSGFGATVRQSILGLDVFGPDIFGAKTRADVRADFFGGFPNTTSGINAGLFRLRTAGLRLDWQQTSLVVGQYTPFFSPLSPTSLASVAYPALASSGNLWVWTPQIFIEHHITLSDGSSVSLQGGIMDPLTGELPGNSYYRSAQAGERAGQPAYAARVAWAHSSPYGPLSVGAGGYYARQNWDFSRVVDAWVGTADWDLPLSHGLSLTGEFYRGRAIGGLGAAEGRSVAFTGPLDDPQTVVHAPNSTGGWAQLKFMPLAKLEFNSAYGEDFSPMRGLQYAYQGEGYLGLPIGRNQTITFNTIYHLRSNLMLSVEYGRLRTAETQPGLFSANQLSLSAAALF